MKTFALSIVLSVAAFLAARPAAAVAPVVENGAFVVNYKIDQQQCPGIEVWDDESVTYSIKTFSTTRAVQCASKSMPPAPTTSTIQ